MTDQLAFSCPEKYASGTPASVDQNPPLPDIDSSATFTKGIPAATFPVTPSTPTSRVVGKAKDDRLFTCRGRKKQQTPGQQSTESSTAKDSDSLVSKIIFNGGAGHVNTNVTEGRQEI